MKSYQREQFIYKLILVIVFIACVTAVIMCYARANIMDSNYFLLTEENAENSKDNMSVISNSLKDFRKMIDEYYIGDIDEQKILDETIKGYVNGLEDEYSEYMTADEWEEYQINTLGNYVGIGIYMTQNTDGNIVVIEPIKDSPAEKVGIKKDDIIVEVEGEKVLGMTTDVVSSKIKGEEGTVVALKLFRDGQYVDVNVERKSIKVYRVESEMLENNIGYIKLSTFDNGCSAEFRGAFEKLQSEGAQKLVIDLRDNTGGLVDEALSIAELIVPKGKVMLITVDAKDNKELSISSKNEVIDMEIVVLVNGYSASASEILIGCLQDNKEATIVGTKTYGKGVIQNVFSMSDGSVLKLTTAEYFTPDERKIHKIGITPDVEIEDIEQPKGEEEIDEQLNKALEILNK